MYRSMFGMLLAFACVRAQTFEVVSLKPSGPKSARGSDGGPGSKDPVRYTFGQATALDLILTGYDVDTFQVSSKAALDQYRFDLVATVPQSASKAQFRAMMRNLLAERFHLKTHLEQKEFPAYELVVANTGLKIKEAPPDAGERTRLSSTMSNGGDGTLIQMKAQQASMADVARYLQLPDRTRVFDKTGLTGKYSFTVEYTYDRGGAAFEQPSGVPNVFRAFEQQLGLKLIPKKLPFDVVVVDSIDKVPTEN